MLALVVKVDIPRIFLSTIPTHLEIPSNVDLVWLPFQVKVHISCIQVNFGEKECQEDYSFVQLPGGPPPTNGFIMCCYRVHRRNLPP